MTSAAEPERGVVRAARNETDPDLTELLRFIRDARGFDFAGYKRSSLNRRVRKRMQDVGIGNFHEYQDYLETNTEEFWPLFNTILINVTSFLRDFEAWAHLQEEIVPAIVAAADKDAEIRVWSAGCSSGEEPYSLAIVFAEVLGAEEVGRRVKIYGTDIDDEALREARAGTYSAKALEPVPEHLRAKYFQPSGANFTFRPDLRRRVIFGHHDITKDAPISHLHLLVCRNTLMYFNAEAQTHIVDRFHFALDEGGFLFLGKAEMLLSDGERFEVASMRHRIFRRHGGEPDARYKPLVTAPLEFQPAGWNISSRRQLRDLMLDAMPVAAIAVGADGRVALANAQARAQFRLTTHDVGRSFHELEVSYRPAELRAPIEQAYAERRMVRLGGVERRISPDEVYYLDIVIQPLWSDAGTAVGAVVFFNDITAQTRLHLEIRQTREDLETAYEELQSTNEELETTNEELQSSIEELETTNEELQSTNEELETTNQELQAGNDELENVNAKVHQHSAELEEARVFLEGVLSSIASGVAVLDAQRRVRTWNRGAEDLWGLRLDEVREKPFFDLEFGLPTQQLREVVDACITSGGRSGPIRIPAVNRIGRTITCSVLCSPLNGHGGGVVLLMEEARQAD